MAKKQQKEKSIEETLWESNKLCGSVEPSEYKHVVLSLIFLKYAYDRFVERRNELIADHKEAFVDQPAKNVFYLNEISRWDYLMENAKQNDIAIKINAALAQVEKDSPSLKGALPSNYYSGLGLDRVVPAGGNLVEVVSDYAYALDTLDKYDYQQLTVEQTTNEAKFRATYEGAMQAIEELKAKFGGSQWFAHEKDDSFKSSIGQIYQTFGGQNLYPSVEEKAAMLLYLVTKNHSFSDGNKHIAATLFLWFMAGNGILYNPDGTKRIADNTLVALTLMIAESRTEEKDVMVKVVVNLINRNN